MTAAESSKCPNLSPPTPAGRRSRAPRGAKAFRRSRVYYERVGAARVLEIFEDSLMVVVSC